MNDAAAPAPPEVGLCRQDRKGVWVTWLPVAVGIAILYVPTYVELTQAFAGTEDGAQVPIILVVCAWLIWKRRALLQLTTSERSSTVAGVLLIILAALMYVIG